MSILIRAAFLGLILLSAHQQMHWLGLVDQNAQPLALLESRVASLGLASIRPVPPDVDFVTASGCDADIELGLYTADGDEDARIAPLMTPEVKPLFIYIGETAQTRAQLRPVRAWVLANAKAILGERNTQPPTRFVLALLPVSCPDLGRLNWAALST
jgi:hypothetical protein